MELAYIDIIFAHPIKSAILFTTAAAIGIFGGLTMRKAENDIECFKFSTPEQRNDFFQESWSCHNRPLVSLISHEQ